MQYYSSTRREFQLSGQGARSEDSGGTNNCSGLSSIASPMLVETLSGQMTEVRTLGAL